MNNLSLVVLANCFLLQGLHSLGSLRCWGYFSEQKVNKFAESTCQSRKIGGKVKSGRQNCNKSATQVRLSRKCNGFFDKIAPSLTKHVCVYLRFKQWLNMIGRKLALLSLNPVQTLRVPRAQPKIWRKIPNNWRSLVWASGISAFWMYYYISGFFLESF